MTKDQDHCDLTSCKCKILSTLWGNLFCWWCWRFVAAPLAEDGLLSQLLSHWSEVSPHSQPLCPTVFSGPAVRPSTHSSTGCTGLVPDVSVAADWYEEEMGSHTHECQILTATLFRVHRTKKLQKENLFSSAQMQTYCWIQSTLKAVFTLYSTVVNHSLDQTAYIKKFRMQVCCQSQTCMSFWSNSAVSFLAALSWVNDNEGTAYTRHC